MPQASRLIFLPLAYADVSDIAVYTHLAWGESQMDAYLQAIDVTLSRLLQHPEIGQKRPDISAKHRSMVVKHHVVYYYVEADAIYISRILHEHMSVTIHPM